MPWIAVTKARFTDAVPHGHGATAWNVLHHAADQGYGVLVRLVHDILSAAGTALDRPSILRALESSDLATLQTLIEPAFRALSESLLTDMPAVLEDVVTDGATASQPELERLVGTLDEVAVDLTFGGVNDAAAEYAAQRSAQLVRDVDENTRQGIRDIIHRAIEDGTTPQQTMDDIHQMIGLTDRQAQSVQRYRQQLIDTGKNPGDVQRLLARRIDQVKGQRAETIARTETLDAANTGQHVLWTQAQQQGLVPGEARKFVILTPDERLCQICRPIPGMNRDGRRLDEPFDTPAGPKQTPTFHPKCRCTSSIRLIGRS